MARLSPLHCGKTSGGVLQLRVMAGPEQIKVAVDLVSIGRRIRDILPATINAGPENGRWNLSVRPRSLGPSARNPGTEPPLGCGISRNSLSLNDKGIGVSCGQPSALVDPVFVFRQNAGGGARVPKPCTERDRLRQANYQATLEVSASCGALPSTPFGPEFTAALHVHLTLPGWHMRSTAPSMAVKLSATVRVGSMANHERAAGMGSRGRCLGGDFFILRHYIGHVSSQCESKAAGRRTGTRPEGPWVPRNANAA
jgi:hypothetical protein